VNLLSILETVISLVDHAQAAGNTDLAGVAHAAIVAMTPAVSPLVPTSTDAEGRVKAQAEADHVARLQRIANLIAALKASQKEVAKEPPTCYSRF
jgi:hypothetical protein